MTRGHAREAAIEEELAGLPLLDVAPGLSDVVRGRMHHHLARKTSRRVRQGDLTRLPHRMAGEAALVATLVLLYLSAVVRHALDFYGR